MAISRVNACLLVASLCFLGWMGHASAGIVWHKPPGKNFTLPPLPYDYTALEPYIDNQTMHFHHDTHHATYITNLNNIRAANPTIANLTLTQLIQLVGAGKLAADVETGVRNQGGGAWNHAMFWKIMAPPSAATKAPLSSGLAENVNRSFGSWEAMVQKVTDAAKSRFGSGWAFLAYSPDSGKLFVKDMPNQDNPLMPINQAAPLTPILAIDVWEHAYYLKYGPKRPSYIDAWWKVVNWAQVLANYDAAVAGDLGAIVGAKFDARQA